MADKTTGATPIHEASPSAEATKAAEQMEAMAAALEIQTQAIAAGVGRALLSREMISVLFMHAAIAADPEAEAADLRPFADFAVKAADAIRERLTGTQEQ